MATPQADHEPAVRRGQRSVHGDRLHDRSDDGVPWQPDRSQADHQRRPPFNPSIADRFDLSVECVRRDHLDAPSPLSATLDRYHDLFALFEDFCGYVEYFFLDDLVDRRGDVRFFMPFNDFHPPAVPKDLDTYREHRRRSIDFIHARNTRISRLRI
jgi:hypothetical protein